MFIYLLLFTLKAFAASDSTDAFEKTFGRDNTFCSYQGKKVEIMIRGLAKRTDPREMGYGEFLFYKREDIRPHLLELNKEGNNTYRLFHGTSPLCSKSHGYEIDSDTIAILLHRENQPFKDQLVIQLFDSKSLTPKKVIETDYATDKVQKSDEGFVFQTENEEYKRDIGKVAIEGNAYIYQERLFPMWINFSNKGFSTNTTITFNKFPWKSFFKDIDEFLKVTGWNSQTKTFTNVIVFEAVNYSIRKRCLLLVEKKQNLIGTETWRCQAM